MYLLLGCGSAGGNSKLGKLGICLPTSNMVGHGGCAWNEVFLMCTLPHSSIIHPCSGLLTKLFPRSHMTVDSNKKKKRYNNRDVYQQYTRE